MRRFRASAGGGGGGGGSGVQQGDEAATTAAHQHRQTCLIVLGDDEGDVVLLGVLQPAILDTFRVTITESSCLSLPRLEIFWNLSILASHVIIGFVVVVEFRKLRHVCVVRHESHETHKLQLRNFGGAHLPLL